MSEPTNFLNNPHSGPLSMIAEWPRPDVQCLPEKKRGHYNRRKLALEMHASGATAKEIWNATQIGKSEIYRLIQRCISDNDRGIASGFYGCLPWIRQKDYTRKTEAQQSDAKSTRSSTGALGRLLREFPALAEYIEILLFKIPSKDILHESKISKSTIHNRFLKKAKELGVSDTEWPFNTSNHGYKSLCAHLKDLENKYTDRAATARFGARAALANKIGRGFHSSISARRAYSIMQLDYQRIDAASIFVLVNRFKVEIELEVPRWYFGIICDEYTGLVVGYCIALEANPSGDDALDTVYSALLPNVLEKDDPHSGAMEVNDVLPWHVIPELAFQCFSILKVDNAWANSAIYVVNNLIDVVGCSINFGPVGDWSKRPVVERIIKTLTEWGLQRLPSTYGDNSADVTRTDPKVEAKKFKISIADLSTVISSAIRDYNSRVSPSREGGSPLDIIRAAITRPSSGYISQPLPMATRNDPKLLARTFVCKVVGKPSKGVNPHVNLHDCRYTSPELASRHALIGKELIVYVHRHDIRIAYATIRSTGEDIGRIFPEKRWSYAAVSIRYRQYINRAAGKGRYAPRIDTVSEFFDAKAVELANKKKTSKTSGKAVRGTTAAGGKLPLIKQNYNKKVAKTAADVPSKNQTEGDFIDSEIVSPNLSKNNQFKSIRK